MKATEHRPRWQNPRLRDLRILGRKSICEDGIVKMEFPQVITVVLNDCVEHLTQNSPFDFQNTFVMSWLTFPFYK